MASSEDLFKVIGFELVIQGWDFGVPNLNGTGVEPKGAADFSLHQAVINGLVSHDFNSHHIGRLGTAAEAARAKVADENEFLESGFLIAGANPTFQENLLPIEIFGLG